MSRDTRSIAAGVAAPLVVLLVAGVVLAYLRVLPWQSEDVAVPADDASPEQVVTAYLAALDGHDCDTAEALVTSDASFGAASWCHDVAHLTDVEVRERTTEDPALSGRPAPEEVADVSVSFDLDWRPFHDDVSMEEGPTAWGYLLVRETPDAPWRIFDEGLG